MNDEYITRREIAEQYGKHPQTIVQWQQTGKLKPAYTQNKTNFYRRSDVEKIFGSEVYRVNQGREHGFALTLKGWNLYSKRNSLDDVPISEIVFEYDRPLQDGDAL